MKRQLIVLLMCSLLLNVLGCGNSGGSGSADTQTSSGQPSGQVNTISTENSVKLEWQLSGDSFKVTRYRDGIVDDETMVSTKSVIVNELESQTSYTFTIESNTDSIFAFAGTNYGVQPAKIGAIAYNGSAQVIWESVPDAINYELYISTKESKDFTRVGVFNTTSTIVENLDNDKTYYFRIQAIFAQKPSSGKNSTLKFMAVLPGYIFGEVTAVTPSDAPIRTPKIFRGKKKGNEIHFMWDAVPNALTYNLKHSADNLAYTLRKNVSVNNDIMRLPVINQYHKVSAIFNSAHEGQDSQFIKLEYSAIPEWIIKGGIESVTVDVINHVMFEKVELQCIGVGESEWFSTALNKPVFTAGWLEGGMDYDCKLNVTYADNSTAESDIKRVYVLPYPESEKLSVYVWDNNATIRWYRDNATETYNIYLQADNATPVKKAENISELEYTFKNLRCDVEYNAFIETNDNGIKELSMPIDFIIDNGTWCTSNPGTPTGNNTMNKIKPAGFSINGYHSAIEHDEKIYVADATGLYEFDPEIGSDGKWTKLATIKSSVNCVQVIGAYKNIISIVVNDGTFTYDLNQPEKGLKKIANIKSELGGHGYAMDGKNFYLAYDSIKIIDMENYNINSKSYNISNQYYHGTSLIKFQNNLYMFGGSYHNLWHGTYTNRLLKYDLDTNNWSNLTPTGNIPPASVGTGITTAFGKIYIYGGAYTNKFYSYDPSIGIDGEWKEIVPAGTMPPQARGQTITNLNGKLYIIGGWIGNAFIQDIYVYEP